ncbi:MAG: rod shape-determining protein MreC [Patescibacteria group bacterium]|jgi:rod shape-determining protein MreC
MPNLKFRLSTIVILIGVIIFFVILSLTGAIQIVQKISRPILLPIARLASTSTNKIGELFKGREEKENLMTENKILQQRVIDLEINQASLNRQLSELQILKSEEEFLNRNKLKGIPVRVIGRSQTSAQQILLDAGKQQGIIIGSPVLAVNGVLIGIIYEVGEATSSLKLLTSDGMNVAARVENETSSPGIINGEKGVGIRLNLVPQNQVLKEAQTIVTSDLDPKVPNGLLIGAISKIEQNPGALFQSASVIPSISYDKLNVLMVLNNQ